eukprot:UN11927
MSGSVRSKSSASQRQSLKGEKRSKLVKRFGLVVVDSHPDELSSHESSSVPPVKIRAQKSDFVVPASSSGLSRKGKKKEKDTIMTDRVMSK